MLSVDDTSFVKKGTHCIGVKRQYCGSLGKRENCQVGVFLSYAGDSGYGLVDYELYIPEEWFQDLYQDLRTRCRLPGHKRFLTKNRIAQGLINHAYGTGRFLAQWVGCDAAYGCDHAFLYAEDCMLSHKTESSCLLLAYQFLSSPRAIKNENT